VKKPILISGLVAALLVWAVPSSAGDDLAKQLQSPSRSQKDKDRDAATKPVEVLKVLGVKHGMSAVDLIAAGGYWTEVLSYAVGKKGKVYAQNPKFVLEVRDGVNNKELTERLANNRLPNVQRLDREITDLGLAPSSIDFAITSLNYHDIYNSNGAAAALSFLSTVKTILKPGGVFAIIDHAGVAGADNAKLHRIEKSIVIAQAKEAGFVVETDSNLLANPADDHTLAVFDPSLRGHTDRFVLKLRKPKA